MITTIHDDFNLHKIADSGQCFRWEQVDAQSYRIIAGARCVYVTDLGEHRYKFSCEQEEFDAFWHPYLDLDEDYAAIRSRIDPGRDPFLWKAAEAEQGIRILRQDPWEMLITFIISQNRNIPAIKRSVEFLAESCGEKQMDAWGRDYYAFPTPEAVAALSESALAACRLGYRCRYVHAAAVDVAEGRLDLEALRADKIPWCTEVSRTDISIARPGEARAMEALTSVLGVGVKVASCVALFGLHYIDAFPRDVWINRVLAREYPEGYPFDEYSPYNGVYQQYMFAYYRGAGDCQ